MIWIPALFAQNDFILTRDSWGAKPPLPFAKTHEIKMITIHHAGVATNSARTNEEKLRALQSWSQREDKLASGKTKPAWPDIPYHYYLFRDGRIYECRPWNLVGDTNTEYDPSGHLLICLEGNFEIEEPSGAQIRSLQKFVEWSASKWQIDAPQIQSHRDYSKQTTCPGPNLDLEIPKIRWRMALLSKCKGG